MLEKKENLSNKKKLIGILGGTFDPIHCGHLHIAKEIINKLPIEMIQFIPCAVPPHRNLPIASNEQRLAMLRLAIANHPKFQLNTIELNRAGPSYTIDTLNELKQEEPNQNFALMMGADVFLKFNKWHQWQNILTKCHLVVVNRNQTMLNDLVSYAPWLQAYEKDFVDNPDLLCAYECGKIFLANIPRLDISATELRQKIRENNWEACQKLLPISVLEYIRKNKIYFDF